MNAPGCSHVMSFAGDAPFLPHDLVARLAAAIDDGAEIARAKSFGQRHPVFCLWPVSIRSELRDQLVNHGIRKIDLFTSAWQVAEVTLTGSIRSSTSTRRKTGHRQNAICTGLNKLTLKLPDKVPVQSEGFAFCPQKA